MAAPQLPIPAGADSGAIARIPSHGARVSAAPQRRLSPGQRAAIAAVMQIFVEDDLACGTPETLQRACAACKSDRPAPGFITYEGHDLCNACALEYELDRAEGRAPDAGDWVRRHTHRRPALTRLK